MATHWLDYDPVSMRYVTGDGTTMVGVITLSFSGNGRNGEWLRVSRHGTHIADVRTVAELAGLGIDLADLQAAD